MPDDPSNSEFFRLAEDWSEPGIIREFWQFIRQNKKWWIIPLIIALFVFGWVALLTGTQLAPLIYTIF